MKISYGFLLLLILHAGAKADDLYRCTTPPSKPSYQAEMCEASQHCEFWTGASWTACQKIIAKTEAKPVANDKEMHVIETTFACKENATLDRLSEIVSQHDQEAIKQYMILAAAAGECTLIETGTKVYYEDSSIWSGRTKVRPSGKLISYWTFTKNIK